VIFTRAYREKELGEYRARSLALEAWDKEELNHE
jgi:hypothetical protein